MLNFIWVSFCNAYIIVTFRVRVRVEVWRFGATVSNALVLSTQLLYIEPG